MSQIATFIIRQGDMVAQEELNAFLRGHRVLQIDHAFTGTGWAFCVEWLDCKVGDGTNDWSSRRIDYRELLPPEQFERFSALRERRKVIATEDGVPRYVVMTDAQLAEAAKANPLTLEVLKGINGFGEVRVQKYGKRLLGIDGGEKAEIKEN